MSDSVATGDKGAETGFVINKIGSEAPWTWLAKGWQDLKAAKSVGLTYGLIFAVVSGAITMGLWSLGYIEYLPPLAAGFMLVGPLLAVGLYETSRRREMGEKVSLGNALFVKTGSPSQLAFMAVILMVALLFWMRIASLLFALFMGTTEVPPPEQFLSDLLLTQNGIALLIVGSLIGAVIAAVVFAISIVSVPMLMERRVDAITAVITSLKAVGQNWKTCLLWGWLVVLLMAAGIATLFVGMIVTFPLVGFASWHAYRSLVQPRAQ